MRAPAASARLHRIMPAREFAFFDTDVGRCGITWGPGGIVGVQLPERNENATRARLLRRYPDARETPPPPHIRPVIDNIVALLHGEERDLSDITGHSVPTLRA